MDIVHNLSLRIASMQCNTSMGGEIGETEREQANYAFIDARLVSPSLHFYESHVTVSDGVRVRAQPESQGKSSRHIR